MASRFVRSVRNVRDIEKQPLFTNEQNDLLQTKDGDVYVRVIKGYEKITGLEDLEKTFTGFKKQMETKTSNTQKKLNDYIKNNDETLKQTTKEINDRLDKLELANNNDDTEA